jgi:hypothetical protein
MANNALPTNASLPMQGCFKLLAALLRECPAFSPPPSQLRSLVAWAFTDVDAAEARQPLFSLLKAVLDRKVVQVVEVYDVMTRVQARAASVCRAPVATGFACTWFRMHHAFSRSSMAGLRTAPMYNEARPACRTL